MLYVVCWIVAFLGKRISRWWWGRHLSFRYPPVTSIKCDAPYPSLIQAQTVSRAFSIQLSLFSDAGSRTSRQIDPHQLLQESSESVQDPRCCWSCVTRQVSSLQDKKGSRIYHRWTQSVKIGLYVCFTKLWTQRIFVFLCTWRPKVAERLKRQKTSSFNLRPSEEILVYKFPLAHSTWFVTFSTISTEKWKWISVSTKQPLPYSSSPIKVTFSSPLYHLHTNSSTAHPQPSHTASYQPQAYN